MDFDAALTAWLARCQERIDKHYAAHCPRLTIPHLEVMRGPKFLRIVRADGTSRSAFAFVEKATGNVYKPKSWKGPTRNFARGSIYGDHGGMASDVGSTTLIAGFANGYSH